MPLKSDVFTNRIGEKVDEINGALRNGLFVRHLEALQPDVSKAERLELRDASGPIRILAAGRPVELYSFLQGMEEALIITNRL